MTFFLKISKISLFQEKFFKSNYGKSAISKILEKSTYTLSFLSKTLESPKKVILRFVKKEKPLCSKKSTTNGSEAQCNFGDLRLSFGIYFFFFSLHFRLQLNNLFFWVYINIYHSTLFNLPHNGRILIFI